MKFFKKVKHSNGSRQIYLLGIKVFSYKKRGAVFADLAKNYIKIPSDNSSYIKIVGTDNSVVFDSDCENVNLSISIYGNHNSVHIGKDCTIQGTLVIGVPDTFTENCVFSVGAETHVNGMNVLMLEKGTCVCIGKRCLFSDKVILYASDTHAVLDNERLINRGKNIIIGEHVWIGLDVKILKNTFIPDNCIVGMGSIVTKKFTDPNCVIAGNPARVVKKGINWDKKRPDIYEQDYSQKKM